MKNVLLMFGGVSAEHEVSIITGLQVAEKIDRSIYTLHVVYVNKQGEFLYLPGLKNRQDFKPQQGKDVSFGQDAKGAYMQQSGMLGSRVYLDAAYLAFHGGLGESGPAQGMLEMLQLPFTSPGGAAAAITMNKALGKEVLQAHNLPVLDWLSCAATAISANVQAVANQVLKQFPLPVIIKPAHLGSSIGINIAKTEVELQKFLLAAAMMDSEILVEPFLTGFTEYNCAVRLVNGQLEASEVEKPLSKDEILSFADKYQRGGGKKQGNQAGMASLVRELPAQISSQLRDQIQDTAKAAFLACRCKGMVRIDFMHTADERLLITEINPIPGSMAYYLWEASGINFTQQITDLIEQAIKDQQTEDNRVLDYHTDIVEQFISSDATKQS